MLPPRGSFVALPEHLDDLVFVLPAVTALAGTGRRLSLRAAAPLLPIAEQLPGAAAVLFAEWAPGRLLGELRRGDFAEAVLLTPDWEPAWAAWRAGVPRRWGYRGGLRGWLLAPAVRGPSRRDLTGRPAAEELRELLTAMDLDLPADLVPRLPVPERLSAAARERLARAGIAPPEHPLVGLIPVGRLGDAGGRRERRRDPAAGLWPWPHYAELLRRLRRRVQGVRGVLVAGREDLWPAVRIHEETGRLHPLIGPDLDAAGIAALLGELDLVVAADSELLQLAVAVGAPTVALFGPTDPVRRAPRGERHRQLSAPDGDLRGLAVEPVLAACEELLAGERP